MGKSFNWFYNTNRINESDDVNSLEGALMKLRAFRWAILKTGSVIVGAFLVVLFLVIVTARFALSLPML